MRHIQTVLVLCGVLAAAPLAAQTPVAPYTNTTRRKVQRSARRQDSGCAATQNLGVHTFKARPRQHARSLFAIRV